MAAFQLALPANVSRLLRTEFSSVGWNFSLETLFSGTYVRSVRVFTCWWSGEDFHLLRRVQQHITKELLSDRNTVRLGGRAVAAASGKQRRHCNEEGLPVLWLRWTKQFLGKRSAHLVGILPLCALWQGAGRRRGHSSLKWCGCPRPGGDSRRAAQQTQDAINPSPSLSPQDCCLGLHFPSLCLIFLPCVYSSILRDSFSVDLLLVYLSPVMQQ